MNIANSPLLFLIGRFANALLYHSWFTRFKMEDSNEDSVLSNN